MIRHYSYSQRSFLGIRLCFPSRPHSGPPPQNPKENSHAREGDSGYNIYPEVRGYDQAIFLWGVDEEVGPEQGLRKCQHLSHEENFATYGEEGSWEKDGRY